MAESINKKNRVSIRKIELIEEQEEYEEQTSFQTDSEYFTNSSAGVYNKKEETDEGKMDFLEQLKKMEEAKLEMEKEMEREGIRIEKKRRATLNPGQVL